MTFASIIVPAFNVAKTLPATLGALRAQTHRDFEIIVIDDGSTDETYKVAQGFASDPRIRIIRQANRGLAGARNSGIAAASGDFLGFCDADDLWEPEKLATHLDHLNGDPTLGISYSGSTLINDNGHQTGHVQRPKLLNIDAVHILKRNPIGNGSAALFRRAVFEHIAYRPKHEKIRDWYFDETFRQSEDIECWLRIALRTSWRFEGVPGLLTQYRINSGGLSAATDRQHDAWERMVQKLSPLAPDFFARHTTAARAYQLRYLCRRAISDLDAIRAAQLARAWLATSWQPFLKEPRKSTVTLGAVMLLHLIGPRTLSGIMALRSSKV